MHSVEPLNQEQKTPRLNPFGVLLAKKFNGAGNRNPETRNPKPESRNKEQITRNQELETPIPTLRFSGKTIAIPHNFR